MWNNSDVFSSLAHSREAAQLRSEGVAGNPVLAGGILVGTSLLGLLTIIWAFWYQHSSLSVFKRACLMSFTCRQINVLSVEVIHSALLSLLTVDAVNLIAAMILGTEYIQSGCYNLVTCINANYVWFLSRWLAVLIHLMNALLSIRYLCQPQSRFRANALFSLISVLIVVLVPLYLYVTKVALIIFAIFLFVFALGIIAKFTAPTSSPSTATLKKLIVVVSMCTFLVVYFPSFILQCLLLNANDFFEWDYYNTVYVNVLYFTNCHIILNGLQCALILKLPSRDEEQQQPQQQQWQQQQQQQWQQQQQQQWQQQQWQQQQQQQWQQQQLGFQNAGFAGSTNVTTK